jgi:hypothetical protein
MSKQMQARLNWINRQNVLRVARSADVLTTVASDVYCRTYSPFFGPDQVRQLVTARR